MVAMTDVGARIAKFRQAAALTGEQLGAAVGLTKSQVSKVESGVRGLDVSEVAAVADALGVTLADLLGVERSASLALAVRVMAAPSPAEAAPARRRLRQLLEADATLADSGGLRQGAPNSAGRAVLGAAEEERLGSAPVARGGERLAELVRGELGLGRGPIADLADLAERHFGVDVCLWPCGRAVSGLCAHGDGVAMLLISTSFPLGHQRFTTAHELAHHLLGDPREVVVDGDLFDGTSPAERRANVFAAALLAPEAGLVELIADRPVDEAVVVEALRHFGLSYTALIHRLRSVGILGRGAADQWLSRTATEVLRQGGDPAPTELTVPNETRRVPPRLWRAAQSAYAAGRIGIGVLASLRDEDAEETFDRLVEAGVVPPALADGLADV